MRPTKPTTVVGSKDPVTDPSSAKDVPFEMAGVGKHTLIYGLGVILERTIGFMMLPVYTRFLTPDDYGVMGLIVLTLDMAAIFAGVQLVAGLFHYYHKAKNEDERKAIVSTSLFGLSATYALVCTICFLSADFFSVSLFDTTAQAPIIRVAAVTMFFQGLFTVPLGYARVQDRSTFWVSISLTKLILSLVLNIIFLWGFGLGVMAVFLSSLIGNALIATPVAWGVIRKVGIRFAPWAVRDLLRFGIPMVGVQMGTWVATFADRYFILKAGGEAEVGLYDLSYKFGFILAGLTVGPFNQVWGPKRFEIVKREDRAEVLSRGFLYMNLALLTGFVGISLFVNEVVVIMTTPEFYSASTIVPIILAAFVLQSWTGTLNLGIHIRERNEYLTLATWVAASIALIGYWLVVPRLLGFGAALVTVTYQAMWFAMVYFISQRLYHISYHWTPVLKLVGVAIVTVLIGLAAQLFWAPIEFLVQVCLFAAYLFVVWKSSILTKEEKAAGLQFGIKIVNWVKSRFQMGRG